MVIVGVSTCTRPGGVDYLPGTLLALETAGALAYRRVVVADGGRAAPCAWPLMTPPRPMGSRFNLWRLLMVAYWAEAARLVFFEDDVRPCRGAVRRLAELVIPPDVAFVSAFDCRRVAEGAGAGVHPFAFDEGPFMHSQALVFPAETIDLLAHLPPAEDGDRMGADTWIAQVCARAERRWYGVHVPSLVRHVGDVSVAHAAPCRFPVRNYPGDDFDAGAL